MRPVAIGVNADNQTVHITPGMRQSTHMHVIGGSGTGKSKFLEWLIRKDVREGHGFCLVDWHGTLYDSVLRYCAELDVGLFDDFRRLILINPSQPDYVTGFNPFMNRGVDVSVQVRNRIDATIRPWGMTDTNTMPTFESVMRALYTFAVEKGEPLTNAAHLLDYDRQELREYAASVVTDPEGRRQLRRLLETKTLRDWREMVLSTDNRLGRFLGSKTVRRFMGLPQGNLDLLGAMNEGAIVLVNLGSSGYLDRESARVFASLLLNEFFETAMQRAQQAMAGKQPETYSLYLDEFQEYITDDVAAMLDQVRKGGLHMVLAHQHLGHLADNPRLLKSIFTNARLRAVFGGLDYEDASFLANEMFLPDLNTRQIKKAYYHTTHLYREETRQVRSRTVGKGKSESMSWSEGRGTSVSEGRSSGHSEGSGYATGHSSSVGSGANIGVSFSAMGTDPNTLPTEGWYGQSEGQSSFSASGLSESDVHFSSASDSETFATSESEFSTESRSVGSNRSLSEGESVVPVWVPIPVQELGSETEWGREEKVSKVAEMLKTQQQRHCFIKLDTERTAPLQVPFVKHYSTSEESLLEYERAVYRAQNALEGAKVDRLLEENEERFLRTSQNVIDVLPAEPRSGPEPDQPAKPKRGGRSARESIFAKIKTSD
jgi:hypothetical protein